MEDAQQVYEDLAAHLNRLPSGFPRTESGVEIRILKRLFTPEEAALALLPTFRLETVQQIAARTGRDGRLLAPALEAMSRKGLIFRLQKGKETCYMAAQFMVGIWEYHVNDLTPELVREVNEYFPRLLRGLLSPGTPQVRFIPATGAIEDGPAVMPYEDARRIIDQQEKIVAAPCICRKEQKIIGKGCEKPMESCLVFGFGAEYYEGNGIGRVVDRDEALAILKHAEEAGLVLCPSNAQNATNICTCCGCCCQVLKNLRTLPRPAELVLSNYLARVDEGLCSGCGICLERCQMDALHLEGGCAVISAERCIGCGLCVPTCDSRAIALLAKERSLRREPPVRLSDMHMQIARERTSG